MQLSLARVFAIFFITLPIVLQAQERGQYLPGSGGLNSGIQTPTGFSYLNVPGLYSATQAKDPSGRPVPVSGGPKASLIVPKWDLSFLFRYEPEFGATSHIEGTTMMFEAAISFPVAM